MSDPVPPRAGFDREAVSPAPRDEAREALLAFAKEAGHYARECGMLRMQPKWDEWIDKDTVRELLAPAVAAAPLAAPREPSEDHDYAPQDDLTCALCGEGPAAHGLGAVSETRLRELGEELFRRAWVYGVDMLGDPPEDAIRRARDLGVQLVRALRAVPSVPPSEPSERVCTCVGHCRGKDGLGAGWTCALTLPSPAPRDEARENVEVWRETYYRVLNTPGITPPVGWRGVPGDYQREQALIAACNAVALAAAPRADPPSEEYMAEVIRLVQMHELYLYPNNTVGVKSPSGVFMGWHANIREAMAAIAAARAGRKQ